MPRLLVYKIFDSILFQRLITIAIVGTEQDPALEGMSVLLWAGGAGQKQWTVTDVASSPEWGSVTRLDFVGGCDWPCCRWDCVLFLHLPDIFFSAVSHVSAVGRVTLHIPKPKKITRKLTRGNDENRKHETETTGVPRMIDIWFLKKHLSRGNPYFRVSFSRIKIKLWTDWSPTNWQQPPRPTKQNSTESGSAGKPEQPSPRKKNVIDEGWRNYDRWWRMNGCN